MVVMVIMMTMMAMILVIMMMTKNVMMLTMVIKLNLAPHQRCTKYNCIESMTKPSVHALLRSLFTSPALPEIAFQRIALSPHKS